MSIERVTITIKKDVLKRIDNMVNKESVKNRSHAIEQLLQKAIGRTAVNTALIMAGGDGASLRPITYEISKAMIPVRGKPILEHQINMLKKNGIENIIIAINKKHEDVKNYFCDGSKHGVKIDYIVEERPLGTAGALSLLKDKLKSTFLMINVDTLIDPDIYEMVAFHQKHQSLATVVLATSPTPNNFGVVKMKGHQIINFSMRPKNAESNLVDAGVYIMEPDIIKYARKKMDRKDLFSELCLTGKLNGFLHDGKIFDIGTPAGYEKAIKEWKVPEN